MEKEYRELFDGVRASGRLRMEVMNMKREETKRVRRIPRAALIAAALVLALAGTAVAYLSRVTVAPYGDGYSVHAEAGNVPLASLSEVVLQRAAAGFPLVNADPYTEGCLVEDKLRCILHAYKILPENYPAGGNHRLHAAGRHICFRAV